MTNNDLLSSLARGPMHGYNPRLAKAAAIVYRKSQECLDFGRLEL